MECSRPADMHNLGAKAYRAIGDQWTMNHSSLLGTKFWDTFQEARRRCNGIKYQLSPAMATILVFPSSLSQLYCLLPLGFTLINMSHINKPLFQAVRFKLVGREVQSKRGHSSILDCSAICPVTQAIWISNSSGAWWNTWLLYGCQPGSSPQSPVLAQGMHKCSVSGSRGKGCAWFQH